MLGIAVGLWAPVAAAKIIHVDVVLAQSNPPGSAIGSERLPFATIKAGLARAEPGDTVTDIGRELAGRRTVGGDEGALVAPEFVDTVGADERFASSRVNAATSSCRFSAIR